MVQILSVGMYWKQIKGRFGGQHGMRRTYLLMKYGYRWLHRAKLRKVAILN